MEHALSLFDDLHDAALDELRQAAIEGTYRGDPYDAPDDCESVITVKHGDLRKARSVLRQALSGSLSPLPDPKEESTRCECGATCQDIGGGRCRYEAKG
jgi:hypothetical protein